MAQCESIEVKKEECEIIKNVLEVELPEYVELDAKMVLETATGKKLSKLLKKANRESKSFDSIRNGLDSIKNDNYFRQYTQF